MKLAKYILFVVTVLFFTVPVAIDWGYLEARYFSGIMLLCFGATLMAAFFIWEDQS